MPLIVNSPAEWRGPEMARRTDWIHRFTPAEVAEIDAALRHARARGATFDSMTKEDFPLPGFQERISYSLDVLENGPGMFLFRGFPVERYSKDDLRYIYWGIGRNYGTAISQSSAGDLLGDVKNFNVDLWGAKGRGYTSNAKLSYHTDFSDVVCLFVLQTARSGGLSIIGSTVTLHNEVARRRPDLLDVLYQPYPLSWQGQEPENAKPWYQMPVFTVHKGKFACVYVRSHILSSQRFDDAPRLTPKQLEAMDLLDELAADPAIHYSEMFQPGDLQMVNNHVLFHSRTAFEDYDEPEKRRHLLRLWLAVPNSRELSPLLSPIYGEGQSGAVRGGFPSLTGQHIYETRVSVT